MGFGPQQIRSDGELYTPLLDVNGECEAENLPNLSTVFATADEYAYMPNGSIMTLTLQVKFDNHNAQPEHMVEAVREAIADANTRYRFDILNRLTGRKRIYPKNLYTHKGENVTLPLNIFPISCSLTVGGEKFGLTINTSEGIGSIVDLRLRQDNVLGLVSYQIGREGDKPKKSTIFNIKPLGVQGQHCIISSHDLHMSRSIIQPAARIGQALVAVFPLSDGEPYTPTNRLSSSSAYNRMRFKMSSMHNDRLMTVKSTEYAYNLCFEFRPLD